MIPIQGVDHVALNVRDIDKAVAFYTDVIGLKITQREPSKPGVEYFLDCGQALIGIIQAKDLNDRHPFADKGLGANHFSFRIHARDFEGMIQHLEHHGVRVEFAKKREKSWSLYFYDLDGNKLEMTSWPREDGLPAEQLEKMIYDPLRKRWEAY
jgi:catechol-2,3-dioxygenase